MEKTKILVRPTSSNLWWGIYGFCEKTGWEDLNLFYTSEKRIGRVCLNTKSYLRVGVQDLKQEAEEKEYVSAIERYLGDGKCHYWYYYDDRDEEDFYEAPYSAPKNGKGIKPRFTEIWHPDESISISTIESGVRAFAIQHLGVTDCEIEIQNTLSFEESLQSFKEHQETFGGDSKIEVKFTDQLVEELSKYWQKSKEDVLKKLEDSIK